MAGLDLGDYDTFAFDCFGTIVDWDRGMLDGLRAVLDAHGAAATDAELLDAYARHEAALEAGPYLPYRELVGRVLRAVLAAGGLRASEQEAAAFGASVGDWPPSSDSVDALRRRILHVAQSLYHDHVPAARIGLRSAWIDRRGEGSPDRVPGAAPDLILPDLRSLAEWPVSRLSPLWAHATPCP